MAFSPVPEAVLALIHEARGGSIDGTADKVLGGLAERVHSEWAAIVRVLSHAHGAGWEEELPLDLDVGLVDDEHLPSALVFCFADVDRYYVWMTDGVLEIVGGEGTTIYVEDGEVFRRLPPLPVSD